MSEESLAKYVPLEGDRIALRNFCCEKKPEPNKRKQSLLDRLHEKLKEKRRKPTETNSVETEDLASASVSGESSSTSHQPSATRCVKLKGNRNAVKTDLKISFGWIQILPNEKNTFFHVPEKQGGGIRKSISVNRYALKSTLLQIAQDKFFPGSVSVLGNLNEFHSDLYDFKRCCYPDDKPVFVAAAESGLTQMRYYLTTTRLTELNKAKQQSISKETVEYSITVR